jgi:AAA family ATP:ADP antiporter
MGEFSTATGIVTFTMMLLSRVIFKKFGWGVAALITPVMLLVTGLIFFSLVLFSDTVKPTLASMGLTPLYAAVLVGAAQNIFSKVGSTCRNWLFITWQSSSRLDKCSADWLM